MNRLFVAVVTAALCLNVSGLAYAGKGNGKGGSDAKAGGDGSTVIQRGKGASKKSANDTSDTSTTDTATTDSGTTDTATTDTSSGTTDPVASDVTAPVLSFPVDLKVAATSGLGAIVNYQVTALDQVDGDIAPVCMPASGEQFSLGASYVHCYAIDSAGNAASGDFRLDVVDQQPPQLILPSALSAETTDEMGIALSYQVSATDNVDDSVAVSCFPASGSMFSVGQTDVSCEVVDQAGNSAWDVFSVNVDLIIEPGPVTPLPSRTVTISWQIPAARDDGSALSIDELAEYVVAYDTDQSFARAATLVVGALTDQGEPVNTAKLVDLPEGTYYVSVSAIDVDGLASDFSSPVSVTTALQ